jgi:hypothetical protein
VGSRHLPAPSRSLRRSPSAAEPCLRGIPYLFPYLRPVTRNSRISGSTWDADRALLELNNEPREGSWSCIHARRYSEHMGNTSRMVLSVLYGERTAVFASFIVNQLGQAVPQPATALSLFNQEVATHSLARSTP